MKFSLRGVLFVVGMIGLLAVAYLFYFSKQGEKRKERLAEIEKRQRALADLESSTNGIKNLDKQIDDLKQAVSFFESKLPQEKDVETILSDIWKLAESNALQVKTIKPGKTERLNNYSEQPLEMSLSGDFNGFYSFLQKVENLPRLTRVTKMQLTKMSEKDGQMQAQMTLSIFFEPEASKSGDAL